MKKKTKTKSNKVDKRRPIYWLDIGKGITTLLILGLLLFLQFIIYEGSKNHSFVEFLIGIFGLFVLLAIASYCYYCLWGVFKE